MVGPMAERAPDTQGYKEWNCLSLIHILEPLVWWLRHPGAQQIIPN